MNTCTLKKGMNIPLGGAPEAVLAEGGPAARITLYPNEFEGIKPRPAVKVGDAVKRGTILYYSKRHAALTFRSPAAGTVEELALGHRRMLERIVIRFGASDDVEPLSRFEAGRIGSLSREQILAALLDTGYLALLKQRPFSRIPDPAARPKSIFVNAMNTAPFQPDAAVIVRGQETAFQAGLDAMTRLTAGKVRLCLPGGRADLPPALTAAKNVEIHYFAGPHPAGNSSVHIHHLDPIRPHDVVWTVRAVDLVQIGRLLLDGAMPPDRVVTLAGPGVREGERRYYRVRLGAPIEALLQGRLAPGEQRIVAGDVLAGKRVAPDSALRFQDSGICVLPEGRERHFLGWIAPGWNRFSWSPTFLSTWLRRGAQWALDTSRRGSPRAMVLTGLYDRYVPMRIMTDYLLRAVLARDTDEAVKLGLLEVDPEDFALCAFACPSKMDLVGIIRRGLAEAEKEGI
ncbi:MAG TPA: Na(+)-translocating NADH-quinone reductase subunit A [Kiritimatiellia bacterium]|nr:Na(+)-translocating NADH-quinone reductase subunit A [Kiritimatiellia bacterium]HRZ11052.1 Na(+)-translocating NADH-quinone reductase subunit A [Kiritimatiellia bacterium]HSA18625.1 Na(+)-translocating NADH-quinone reductase subunit A [Kiritimatiellia bacterium]